MLPFRPIEPDGAHDMSEETRDVGMNDVEEGNFLELVREIEERWPLVMEYVEQQNFSDITNLQQADTNIASNFADAIPTAVFQEPETSDPVDARAPVPSTETNGPLLHIPYIVSDHSSSGNVLGPR